MRSSAAKAGQSGGVLVAKTAYTNGEWHYHNHTLPNPESNPARLQIGVKKILETKGNDTPQFRFSLRETYSNYYGDIPDDRAKQTSEDQWKWATVNSYTNKVGTALFDTLTFDTPGKKYFTIVEETVTGWNVDKKYRYMEVDVAEETNGNVTNHYIKSVKVANDIDRHGIVTKDSDKVELKNLVIDSTFTNKASVTLDDLEGKYVTFTNTKSEIIPAEYPIKATKKFENDVWPEGDDGKITIRLTRLKYNYDKAYTQEAVQTYYTSSNPEFAPMPTKAGTSEANYKLVKGLNGGDRGKYIDVVVDKDHPVADFGTVEFAFPSIDEWKACMDIINSNNNVWDSLKARGHSGSVSYRGDKAVGFTDVYMYNVEEVKEDKDGITYDVKSMNLKVEVHYITDNNGNYRAVVRSTYGTDGVASGKDISDTKYPEKCDGDITSIEFNNKYVKATSGTLELPK